MKNISEYHFSDGIIGQIKHVDLANKSFDAGVNLSIYLDRGILNDMNQEQKGLLDNGPIIFVQPEKDSLTTFEEVQKFADQNKLAPALYSDAFRLANPFAQGEFKRINNQRVQEMVIMTEPFVARDSDWDSYFWLTLSRGKPILITAPIDWGLHWENTIFAFRKSRQE